MSDKLASTTPICTTQECGYHVESQCLAPCYIGQEPFPIESTSACKHIDSYKRAEEIRKNIAKFWQDIRNLELLLIFQSQQQSFSIH